MIFLKFWPNCTNSTRWRFDGLLNRNSPESRGSFTCGYKVSSRSEKGWRVSMKCTRQTCLFWNRPFYLMLPHRGNGSSSLLLLKKCLVLFLSIYNQESLITMPREQVWNVALGAKYMAESCASSPSSGARVLRPWNLESDLGSVFVSITH